MEARCEPLDAQALAAEVERVLSWIEQRAAVVDVMFGMCYEHVDSQWKWQTIPSAHLRGLLQVSGPDGTFLPGDGDVFLKVPERGVEFTLCHESDIHVAAQDPEIVRSFIARWREGGRAVWVRETRDASWEAVA